MVALGSCCRRVKSNFESARGSLMPSAITSVAMIIFRSIQRNTFIVVLGAILWPTCAIGETQVTDARAAWEAGKIEQAVTLWTTFAAEGDASAQYETGRL